MRTVAHRGRSGGVISVQDCPLSRVRWTRPSSVPAQSWPGASGDSASAKIVQYYSAPLLSGVSSPEEPSFSASAWVRSELIGSQVWPSSTVRKT